MKTALKIIGAGLGLLLLAAASGAIYLAFIFDANRFKPRLTELASEQTGRELRIDGDIEPALFPVPGVKLSGLRLSNAEGFGDQPFAELASADIRIQLMPLLKRRLDIDRITLDGPRFLLARNKNGQTNWSDLLQKRSDAKQGKAATGSQSGFAVSVREITVNNGEIAYEDATTDNRMTMSGLDLRAGPFGSESVPVEAKARWTSRKPERAGTADLASQVLADRNAGRYALRDAALRFEAAGPGLPASGLQGQVRVEGALDLPAQTAQAAVALALLDLTAEAQFKVEAFSTDRRFGGKVVLHEFDPKALLGKIGKPPPPTRDKAVLGKGSLDVAVSGDAIGLTVEPVSARLDDSRLNGRMTLKNYADPVVRFDIRIDQLNLDRYRPPQAAKPPKAGADDALSAISKESLRELKLDMRGTLRIGRLTLNGDRTDNFLVKIEWDP